MATVNLTINAPFDVVEPPFIIQPWNLSASHFKQQIELQSYLSQDFVKRKIGAAKTSRLASFYNRVLRISSADFQAFETRDSRTFLWGWSGTQLNVTIPTWYSAATLKSLEGPRNLENIGKGLIFADNGTVTFEAAYPIVNTACMTRYLVGLTPNIGIPFFEIDGNFSSNITRRYYAPVWLPSPDPKLASMVGIFLYQYLDGADSQPLSRILELAGEGKVFHDEDHSIQIITCTISPY